MQQLASLGLKLPAALVERTTDRHPLCTILCAWGLSVQFDGRSLLMPNPALPATPNPLPPGTHFTPLDADALARLRELDPDGKHGVLPRVLAAFEASLVRFMGQLQTQFDLPNGNSGTVVAGVAHTLKSSSASVGALALAAACAHTEARLRLEPNAELAPEITSLLAQAEAALLAVRAMLQR